MVLGSEPAATSLPLSLVNVEFGHAGQYSCRARLSGGVTDGPVNAGYLRVLGKCAAILIVVTLYLTIQLTSYCGFKMSEFNC